MCAHARGAFMPAHGTRRTWRRWKAGILVKACHMYERPVALTFFLLYHALRHICYCYDWKVSAGWLRYGHGEVAAACGSYADLSATRGQTLLREPSLAEHLMKLFSSDHCIALEPHHNSSTATNTTTLAHHEPDRCLQHNSVRFGRPRRANLSSLPSASNRSSTSASSFCSLRLF